MKITLTRGERFADARTVYNQHGSETIAQVSEATGISASLISDLENDDKIRGASFEKVAILAKHYGVSCDYLAGLEDYRSRNPDLQIAVKTTGLSQESVNFLTHFSKGFVIDYVNDFLPLSGEFFIIMNAVKLNCDKAKQILNDPSVTVEECVDLWRDMKFSKYTLMESAWKVLNTCYNLDELTEQVSTHGKAVKEGSV